VNDSYGEYVFQLRENYFNIYYRGNSLARIGLSTEGTYSVRIHRKFLCGSVLGKMDQYCVGQSHAGGTKVDPVIRFRVKACQLRRFFKKDHLRAISSNIAKVNYQEELVFEQVLMTDNPPTPTLIIIDRQIEDSLRVGKMDLLALFRAPSEPNFHFLVIEVKLGNNVELRKYVGKQLAGYVQHVKENIQDYVCNYEENYRQKKKLRLFGDDMPDEIHIDNKVEGMVVTGGYSHLAEESIKLLHQDYPHIKVQPMRRVIKPRG